MNGNPKGEILQEIAHTIIGVQRKLREVDEEISRIGSLLQRVWEVENLPTQVRPEYKQLLEPALYQFIGRFPTGGSMSVWSQYEEELPVRIRNSFTRAGIGPQQVVKIVLTEGRAGLLEEDVRPWHFGEKSAQRIEDWVAELIKDEDNLFIPGREGKQVN